jgi:hypothetical protein
MIANALLCAVFLILVAALAAVTGSMIALALFDLAFGKETPVGAHVTESDDGQSEAVGAEVSMRVAPGRLIIDGRRRGVELRTDILTLRDLLSALARLVGRAQILVAHVAAGFERCESHRSVL